MESTRVAILRGGPSEEYSVSMSSGQSVLEAIDRDQFNPIDVVITKSGEWLIDGYTRFPEQVLPSVDVVFLALHGTYGEDGTVQRLLDRHGVRYTGTKAFPSSVAMNKVLTKDKLRDFGVQMTPHFVVTREALTNIHNTAETIADLFGPQYVIKPIASGSSVGTMMVKNPTLLPQALKDALETNNEVIVEKRIIGKEATCGVVERFRDHELYALPPIEIVPPEKAEFFDYTNKYNGETQEICPGRFAYETKQEIERIAKLVHEALDLSQYSRSDFMLDNDGIHFLEVNTLPGMTSESLFPKAIEAVGGTYSGFITHLLTDALERR